jgi:addiction module HigA family antidote
MTRDIPLDTPGEILAEEWLAQMGLTQYALAKAIEVPARRINEIVQGKRAITADTAVRLGAFFGVDPQSWMNLQTHYDTEQAREKLGDRLTQIMRNGAANGAIASLR